MQTLDVVPNTSVHRNEKLDAAQSLAVGNGAPAEVHRFLGAFPDYAATPLVDLPGLAGALGLEKVSIKDESTRYGLSSFKALGGAYAVARLVHRFLEERLGRKVDPAEMLGEECRKIASELTVCCATDGNHGRSVASGAQKFGCRCVIFLHSGVSEGREKAIAFYGAEIRRTDGNYDDSVEEADVTSKREGWVTVSDFARPGQEEVPSLVMQGYTLMLEEIHEQEKEPFTHVFVQGGVGGLAAVVAGNFLDRLGDQRPTLVVVEPDRANCLQLSAKAGKRLAMEAGEPTVMAMLECYEPSSFAWDILEKSADYFIAVEDSWAIKALRNLARPAHGDPALTIGESGGAGLAGLLAVLDDEEATRKLGLNAQSRVLLIGTEGATDPELYQQLLAG